MDTTTITSGIVSANGAVAEHQCAIPVIDAAATADVGSVAADGAVFNGYGS